MCTGTHPFIPADRTAKLELIYTLNGQRVENVLHFRKLSEWTAEDLDTLTLAAFDAWADHLGPVQSNAVTLVNIKATDVSTDNGVGVEFGPISNNTGTLQSPPTPSGTTVATKFTTGRTGRSYRGRAYWVGLVEEDVTGNQIGAVRAGTITDGWQNFATQIGENISGAVHVIVSYCGDKAWRTSAVVTPVTGYSTELNIDSQRRRLTGRGQ